MADYLSRAGGFVNWELEQQISEAHLENMGKIALSSLYSGFLSRLFRDDATGDPVSGFWGDDCKLTKIDSATVEIAAGIGYYYDTTDTDAFYSVYKPIVVAAAFQETIAAADSGKHRYDIVCLAPATEDDENETEEFYDPGTGTTDPATTDTRTKFTYAVQIVAGVEVLEIAPATIPSAPDGYIICGRIHVDDTGVLTVSDQYRDKLVFSKSVRQDQVKSESDLALMASESINMTAADGIILDPGEGETVEVTEWLSVGSGIRNSKTKTQMFWVDQLGGEAALASWDSSASGNALSKLTSTNGTDIPVLLCAGAGGIRIPLKIGESLSKVAIYRFGQGISSFVSIGLAKFDYTTDTKTAYTGDTFSSSPDLSFDVNTDSEVLECDCSDLGIIGDDTSIIFIDLSISYASPPATDSECYSIAAIRVETTPNSLETAVGIS